MIGFDVSFWGICGIENFEWFILFFIYRWINYIDMSLEDVV